MTINGKEIHIGDIMRPASTIESSATLKEVLAHMTEQKRNSLAVVDTEGILIGAVNAVDIIKEVVPDYLEDDAVAARFADDELFKEDAIRVQDKPLADFMSTDIPTITKDETLIEAAVLAAKHGRGRITVVDEHKKPIGVLTRTEIKQVIAAYLGLPNELT
jgi:predicted transcriptional regulator